MRRRFRIQDLAQTGALPALVFGNQGLSGIAQSWCEKEERKFLEGKSREEEQGWVKQPELLGGGGHRHLEGHIFLALLTCREVFAKEEKNSAGGNEGGPGWS